jgi:hypothetical protein
LQCTGPLNSSGQGAANATKVSSTQRNVSAGHIDTSLFPAGMADWPVICWEGQIQDIVLMMLSLCDSSMNCPFQVPSAIMIGFFSI